MTDFDFDFSKLFAESKGAPITYKGKTLVMADDIPIGKDAKIRVIFESKNSEWLQGVVLHINKGTAEYEGKIYKKKSRKGLQLCFWFTKKVVECIFRNTDGILRIWNVWDIGDGAVESGYATAMIVEQLPNGRRYRCNDGYPDDDFDDLIFRIEVVEGEE